MSYTYAFVISLVFSVDVYTFSSFPSVQEKFIVSTNVMIMVILIWNKKCSLFNLESVTLYSVHLKCQIDILHVKNS